jgi:hypothetical protein
MKTKMTTVEKRAAAYCETIRAGYTQTVPVDWTTSRDYGLNPRIYHRGEKCTTVSGCGYCKLSAALADVLQWLGNTNEERHSIARQSGCGEPAVIRALELIGWKLTPTAHGKKYDVYSIEKI